jgi:glutathione synthase/RimK-type ligase-like ATP-grasp enzyme
MILVTAPREDAHARHVASLLQAHRRRVRILDFSRQAASVRVIHRVGHQQRKLLELEGEEPLDLADVSTIWYRRPAPVHLGSEVSNPEHRGFMRREWGTTLSAVLMSADVRWINDPVAQGAAHKPLQLEIAASRGLRVPDTLVTNSPEAVEAFLTIHPDGVVHKSLTAMDGTFLDTRRWSESDRAALRDLPLAPTVFQEEIRGTHDVRATIVGERVFAGRFALEAAAARIDSRLYLDAPCDEHHLPADIQDRLLELMADLGLTLGTVDMRITHDGEYVFFEVNPQGQFLYMEILTGMPISAAVADRLAASDRPSIPRRSPVSEGDGEGGIRTHEAV